MLIAFLVRKSSLHEQMHCTSRAILLASKTNSDTVVDHQHFPFQDPTALLPRQAYATRAYCFLLRESYLISDEPFPDKLVRIARVYTLSAADISIQCYRDVDSRRPRLGVASSIRVVLSHQVSSDRPCQRFRDRRLLLLTHIASTGSS